jgi:hypothetical protein
MYVLQTSTGLHGFSASQSDRFVEGLKQNNGNVKESNV